MKEDGYGDKFQDHLVEQYKQYVESANLISERRVKANQFYIAVLSGMLALSSFVINQNRFNSNLLLFIVMSIVGLTICILWHFNINSYKELNKIKFQIIHQIEAKLPFACYTKEWELEKINNRYIRLTRIEKYVPLVLAIPYFFMFIYSLIELV